MTTCNELMRKITTMSTVLAGLKGGMSPPPKKKKNGETDATNSYTACVVDMSRLICV